MPVSTKYSMRTSAAMLIWVSLFGGGVIAIQASPACQRLVRQYSERVKHHKVTQATLARWADWGKAHPNYHPPAKRRPKLTPQETFKMVAFACDAQVAPVDMALNLPPLTPVPLAPVTISELVIPAGPVAPPFTLTGVPTQVPPTPTDLPTPEPSSIILFGTALAVFALFHKRFTGKSLDRVSA